MKVKDFIEISFIERDGLIKCNDNWYKPDYDDEKEIKQVNIDDYGYVTIYTKEWGNKYE